MKASGRWGRAGQVGGEGEGSGAVGGEGDSIGGQMGRWVRAEGQVWESVRAEGQVGGVSRKREGKEEGRRGDSETELGNHTRQFLGRALGRSVMLMLNLV